MTGIDSAEAGCGGVTFARKRGSPHTAAEGYKVQRYLARVWANGQEWEVELGLEGSCPMNSGARRLISDFHPPPLEANRGSAEYQNHT